MARTIFSATFALRSRSALGPDIELAGTGDGLPPINEARTVQGV